MASLAKNTDFCSIQPSSPSSSESVAEAGAGATSASIPIASVENVIVGSGAEEESTSSTSNANKSPSPNLRARRIEVLSRKYGLIGARHAFLQQENDDLQNKITDARIALRRGRQIRMMLIQKLDSIGDNWRGINIEDTTTTGSNTNTNGSTSTGTTRRTRRRNNTNPALEHEQ